jgi:hypothetical protein
MADPITWDSLVKAIGDLTTITEEIQTLILNHNLDPSAHGQSNEAVYNHRISELLDHVSYSIYNVKVNPAARIYKAIVGPGFEADFTTIQQAIDWAHLYGGGIVHIKAGTYVQTDNITLYSDIILEGEDSDLTIIDFNDGEFGFNATGTSGTHLRNIEIKNLQIHDSHHFDYAVVNFDYVDDSLIDSVKFTEITGGEDGGVGCVNLGNCNRVRINNCYLDAPDIAFQVIDSDFCSMEFNYMYNVKIRALYLYGSPKTIFRHNVGNTSQDVSSDAYIYCAGDSNDFVIDSNILTIIRCTGIWFETGARCSITNNIIESPGTLGDGIEGDAIVRSIISNNRIKGFPGSGIAFFDNCDYNTITGNSITDNGAYGVDIQGATDTKNVIVGNALISNASGATQDLGGSTVIASNAS